jgi:two-component system, OmpR family, response regulator
VSDEAQNSRESPRVAGTFRVKYETLDQLVVAFTADLSKGGMFLETGELCAVDELLRVILELPGGSGEIPVTGRVAHVRDADAAAITQKPCGMGIEFLDLTEDCLALIESYIQERFAGVFQAPPAVVPMRRLRLLVVDDDEAIRLLVSAPFKKRGDTVRTAVDGFEAFAMCLGEQPDAIICDVNMPRMDGWQFLRLLRSRPQLAPIPLLFLTALANDEDRLRGYQLGVDDYLEKPYRSKELQARVDRMVARAAEAPRRAEGEATMLRGDLSQVSMASLLSFLQMEQKSGELRIVAEGTARLFVRDGRALRVALDDELMPESPVAALYRVLDWTSGTFEFIAGEIAGEDEIQSTLTALLLEHARLSDEKKR